MSALFPVINHLIQQNPEHQQDLSRLSGKTLSLNLAGFGLTGRINHDGFLETADQPADTLITFHQSAIRKILTGQEPGVGDISLEGDTTLQTTSPASSATHSQAASADAPQTSGKPSKKSDKA